MKKRLPGAETVLLWLVQRVVQLNERDSPAATFQAAWTKLVTNRFYRKLVSYVPERSARRGLHARTFALLAAQIPGFDSSGNIVVPKPLQKLILSGEPFLAIQLHEGFHFLSRTLSDLKRDFVRVTSNPAKGLRNLRKSNVNLEYVHLVKDDLLSLAALRSAVKDKRVICCAVDYADATGQKMYANPAIIDFANKFSLPVMFIRTRVTECGRPELLCEGPFLDKDADGCAHEFLAFFNSYAPGRALSVRRYGANADWGKKERRLFSRRLPKLKISR